MTDHKRNEDIREKVGIIDINVTSMKRNVM
jgi:hypothetical protein